jgi:cytochrome P450
MSMLSGRDHGLEKKNLALKRHPMKIRRHRHLSARMRLVADQAEVLERTSSKIFTPPDRKSACKRRQHGGGLIAELVRVEKKGGGISAGEMVALVFLLLGAGTEMTTRLIQRHYLAINRLKMGATQ